ncbi:MAG: NAD(P)-dependent oxidoreductase [Myxococcales bacterium]|nr:NAD(P)-dependent oxidoreductase [Myxococcales bacterium]
MTVSPDLAFHSVPHPGHETVMSTADNASLRIGLLGLGAMGARMAAAHPDLMVYDRTSAARASLVAKGGRQAESPRGAADGRDIVIACVLDDEASRKVWLKPATGAFGSLKPAC